MKIRLAILGATGMAGRDALVHHNLLDGIHEQYAEITCVTASQQSAGRKLGEVVAEKEAALTSAYPFWKPMNCPSDLGALTIDPTDPAIISNKADYVISALGADIAKEVELALTKLGVHVFSNASAYRWDPKVPLLIPEVNYHHLNLLKAQQTPGKLVCNPNCTTAGYVPVIHALQEKGYRIHSVNLVTQQAISGKGDAIASPEYANRIMGNVIDDWTGEDGVNDEEIKSSAEPNKILGNASTYDFYKQEYAKMMAGKQHKILPIASQTSRVAVQNGHMECLMIRFNRRVSADDIKTLLHTYEINPRVRDLPTTPRELFYVMDGMPSPKEDLFRGKGMTVVVGDIQQHSPDTISLWTLSHNLRRGATWAGRQGLELYLSQKNLL
jgi:aspartate-semialdehyde dehydrogenase